MSERPHLPVDDLLPEIVAQFREHAALVLQAAPGAGKTTRVPPALLHVVPGEVLVLEPRRLPARMAARRIAFERGEEVGGTVGYQVRFEERAGPGTRLRFVTEGVFLRRLLRDPLLPNISAVVLDEFHERHLDGDLALALLLRVQRTSRPDLKIVIMSATLDAARVSDFLGGAPVIDAAGRVFPLAVEFAPYSAAPLHVQVRSAVEQLLSEGHRGHVLVFLPGVAEIRRAMRECEAVARNAGLRMLPLHGDLSPAEQDLAVGPSAEPKLILSTNVAESSITVDGVTAVIDSGLARVSAHSPWTGLPALEVRRISQASALQRAGRAGRTAPGRVLRLYSQADYQQRPEHDLPEILRSDLSDLLLMLRAMDPPLTPNALDWLDAPGEAAVRAADDLLSRLQAGDPVMAKRMARYPLPVRLARMMVAAEDRDAVVAAASAAAILSAGAAAERNDLLEALDAYTARPDPRIQQVERQLLRIAGRHSPRSKHAGEEALLLAVAQGFPDRVARRREGAQMLLANGWSAEMQGGAMRHAFAVALDAENRSDRPLPIVRMASRLEPEWLIDLFPERVREVSTLEWNRAAERVEAKTELRYDDLVLQEWRNAEPDREAAASLLAEEALRASMMGRFVDEEAMGTLAARAEFAGLPLPDLVTALRDVCRGLLKFSFEELRKASANLLLQLEADLQRRRLGELAPATLRLKAGRTVKVHYESGKPPWIASRMQDFFGMADGPRLGPERVPVVMHLLGPNQRAVQTTADLRGFWQRLYPEVRRELMRRYPRHPWPEKPV